MFRGFPKFGKNPVINLRFDVFLQFMCQLHTWLHQCDLWKHFSEIILMLEYFHIKSLVQNYCIQSSQAISCFKCNCIILKSDTFSAQPKLHQLPDECSVCFCPPLSLLNQDQKKKTTAIYFEKVKFCSQQQQHT